MRYDNLHFAIRRVVLHSGKVVPVQKPPARMRGDNDVHHDDSSKPLQSPRAFLASCPSGVPERSDAFPLRHHIRAIAIICLENSPYVYAWHESLRCMLDFISSPDSSG